MKPTPNISVPISSIGTYPISHTMIEEITNLCNAVMRQSGDSISAISTIRIAYNKFLRIAEGNRYNKTQRNDTNGHPETAEYVALRNLDIFDILGIVGIAVSAQLKGV